MPLTTAQLATWASLATLVERLPRALDAQLQESCGLTHFEFGLLYALDAAPERTLRLSTLAGYASSTLSRLSHGWSAAGSFGVRRIRRTDGSPSASCPRPATTSWSRRCPIITISFASSCSTHSATRRPHGSVR